jgi:hypothetical protein
MLSACNLPMYEALPPDARTGAFDPDLYAWKTASWTPFTRNDSITGFAYGTPGGLDCYVAVSSNGAIGWSRDGDIWHLAKKDIPPGRSAADVIDPFEDSSGNPVRWNTAAWGGGRFVAAGNGGYTAWSRDGVHWNAGGWKSDGTFVGITGFGTADIKSAAWGDGYFVAVGANGNISFSAEGIIWSRCNYMNAAFSGVTLNCAVYSESEKIFYIAGDGGNTGWCESSKLRTSGWNHYKYNSRNSGSHPNEKDDPGYPFFGNAIRKITLGKYGDKPALGLVFDEWGGRRMAISTTEKYRANHDWDADLDAGSFGNNSINGIAWGGGYFTAAGQAAMIGWWPSANPGAVSGRYWRALSFTEFRWWEISALAACKDRFFAGNTGGKIGYSK